MAIIFVSLSLQHSYDAAPTKNPAKTKQVRNSIHIYFESATVVT
jgi:hypothetical protein